MSTPSTPSLRVCVYCASSEAVGEPLRQLATETGRSLAVRGWGLVYGGGGIGLMGEVARAAMSGGADVIGVIPERLVGREDANPQITELHVVDTMRQRKHLMDSLADAFLILPGGLGTLEEFMEIITLRQLGYHDRPVVVLDPDGFWDPLLQLFDDMVAAQLAAAQIHRLYTRATTSATALDAIAELARPADNDADWDAALGT